MELRRFIAVIRQRMLLIIFAVLMVAGATYALSVTSTRIYQATATIEINYGSDPRNDAYSSLLVGERAAKTYVEQMRSPQLLREVPSSVGANLSAEALRGMLFIEQVRDTQLIKVTVENPNPELAKTLANRLAEMFIAETEAKQQARFESSKRDLDLQLADLEKQIADTQKAIAGMGDPSDPKNANMPEFARVERTKLDTVLSNYQTRYVILLKSVEDFRLAATRTADNLSIFALAETPRSPARPQTTVNLLLGLVGGLALGFALAFLLDYLDDTAKGPEQITSSLGLTMLGSITRLASMRHSKESLVTLNDGKSPLAEAYRVLRTNFQFSGVSNPHATVVVTSAGPGEGKTTTLANLGVALAQARKRVVLVDADLRRPTLHKLFGVSRECGLTDLIVDPNVTLDKVLISTEVEGLKLLPSGQLPPNPAELLSSARMKEIMDALKEDADVVLFDSPPVLSVADATLLAAGAGNVILVIASGETRTGAVAQARDSLLRTKTRILGAVLNKLKSGEGGYYRYYYYHYGAEEEAHTKARRKRKTAGKEA